MAATQDGSRLNFPDAPRKNVKAAQAVSSSTVDNEVIYSSNRTDRVNNTAQLRQAVARDNPATSWNVPRPALDASQKYLLDCLKSFGSKMLMGKTRAYRVVRFFTAR